MKNFNTKLFVFYIFVLAARLSRVLSENAEKVERRLEINPNYLVSWSVNDSNQEIIFEISVVNTYISPNSYIGFGISLNGAMNGADMAIIKNNEYGSLITIEDRHGIGNVEPEMDSSQDWKLFSTIRNESWTKIQISRPLNTGYAEEDVEITVDTLRLIWAFGQFDPTTGQLYYHNANNRGIVSVNFLDPDVETPTMEQLEEKYEVWKTEKTVQVSSNDTVYMCSFFKGPNVTKKHHMIGFGMFIDKPEMKRHLHHADLYRCTAPPGVNADEFFAPYLGNGYDCNYSPIPFPYDACGTFEFQWTIGGKITLFPDDLGLPLGREDGSTEYFMTEVHFDNPQRRSNLQIRAGFNIYHTPNLRPTEIGQLQLGFMTNKTFSLTVPPNSTDFVISSHCPPEATRNLPPTGIQVFTYLLHSHLSGRRLKLRHWREGFELPALAKDDHFDFNYQNNRRLRTPVQILPGDHLTIECTYDTRWKRGGSTLGGRSAREEMCQAFLLYYPRLEEVNSCGSYHVQEEILGFMGIEEVYQYQGEIDATITSPGHLEGVKYSHIVEKGMNWSTEMREKYQRMIRYGEQRAYCMPIEGKNEAFVNTGYPYTVISVDVSGGGELYSRSDLVIFVAVSVVVCIAVFCSVFYIWNAMRKSGKAGLNSSKEDIVK